MTEDNTTITVKDTSVPIWICLFITIILCVGEPDLIDAFIHYIMSLSAKCP